MIYIIIGVIVFLILIYVVIQYNNIVKLNTMVEEAFSTMDVYLKKRWDLIPNIVEEVKAYSKYEQETFEKIIKLRNSNYNELSNDKKIDTNEEVEGDLNKVMMLAEGYPELKASENFLDLSRSLSEVENDIANSRKYYNGTVKNYNNKIKVVPSNIVAMIFGYKEKKMFETISYERKNVDIKL